MITVLGGSGFIGRRLSERLRQLNLELYVPARDEKLSGRKLGDVIYCIGLTADFRSRPFDTVEAHVCKLLEVLRHCDFDSLLYLSSTRIYDGGRTVATEEDEIRVAPLAHSDLYNISKAMGESLALNCGRRTRVARISNVYGGDFASETFLASLTKDAIAREKLTLHSAPESEKDYISIDNVVDGLIQILTKGRRTIYNLASGVSVSNQALVDRIVELTGCRVEWAPNSPRIVFPRVDISRMREEFSFSPDSVLGDLPRLIKIYRDAQQVWNANHRS